MSAKSRAGLVEDAIARWHEMAHDDWDAAGRPELHEALGWTFSEYRDWMWSRELPPEREGTI